MPMASGEAILSESETKPKTYKQHYFIQAKVLLLLQKIKDFNETKSLVFDI